MEPATPEEILNRTVFVGGRNLPFGELSQAEVQNRADELRSAVGWGPTVRVAPVARAWRELAMAMQRAGVERVGELDPAVVGELAPSMWVVPPGGSLL
jgi:hypothetical protein